MKIFYYHLKFLLLIAALGASSGAQSQENKEVKICYDSGEWPPYTYFKRDNGKINKSAVEGATVELFNEVFKGIGLKHSTTMMAWKRCLRDVTDYDQNGRYEMFTNGSYNEDRANKFYITSPLYRTKQGLFYSTKTFKTPPKIDSPSDLVGYRVCGILGYNYTMYIKLGLKNEIDTRANDLATVLDKIARGRCDFFPSPMEPILVGKKIGVFNYSDVIAAVRMHWAGTTTFHAFISKTSPRAYELYTKINHQLQILQGNGKSDEIFKKWFENGDGL